MTDPDISPAAGHEKKVVSHGIGFPNGVRLTPDQTQLIVDDTHGESCFIFTVLPDKESRRAFVRLLWALARDPDTGVSVVATLRVDFP